MIRNAASKVMWVGRTTVFLVGIAVILAVVLGMATMALAAVPGDPFRLGQVNSINNAVTTLKGSSAAAMLAVDNDSAATTARALDLRVEPGRAPMRVTSDTRVANLNADKLDGQDSSELADPRAFAHIADEGAIDTAYPSKGVDGVVIPTGETSVYCFDLAFTPNAAVGSPFLTNSAVVATVTPPNTILSNECPATHREAAAKTYGSSEGDDVPINFQIVFF